MTSTEHIIDPGAEQASEQVEQVQTELVTDSPLEHADNIGAPLLVALVGGMALTLAVLTPVGVVKAIAVLIVVAALIVAFRLLRRGGGSR
ncbi:hypothetical protein [Amycolatopsis sp. NPDC051903]|uniref:hypothetical protein n=1 Tax=Amycolatopsis sp. NPDC051903 TaxID=3363936 RepID=UPI0037A108B3